MLPDGWRQGDKSWDLGSEPLRVPVGHRLGHVTGRAARVACHRCGDRTEEQQGKELRVHVVTSSMVAQALPTSVRALQRCEQLAPRSTESPASGAVGARWRNAATRLFYCTPGSAGLPPESTDASCSRAPAGGVRQDVSCWSSCPASSRCRSSRPVAGRASSPTVTGCRDATGETGWTPTHRSARFGRFESHTAECPRPPCTSPCRSRRQPRPSRDEGERRAKRPLSTLRDSRPSRPGSPFCALSRDEARRSLASAPSRC